MVERRIENGRRIAELLSSELHGRSDGGLHRVEVTDATEEVEPSPDGTLAYRITADGERLGAAHVHPDRVRVTLRGGLDAAVDAAEGPDLRLRPKAVEPPQALLFVESGAATKRAADAVGAAAVGMVADS
jgi:hypothetical protein